MTTASASDESRQEAVFDAVAAVRAVRADLVDRVRAGDCDYDGIFAAAAADPALATMKLLPAIEALPEVGKVQSRRALEALELSERVLIEHVPESSRDELEALLFGERL